MLIFLKNKKVFETMKNKMITTLCFKSHLNLKNFERAKIIPMV